MDPSGWNVSALCFILPCLTLALCFIVPCLSLALCFNVPCLKICVHLESRVQINGALVGQLELVFRSQLRILWTIVFVNLALCLAKTVVGYDLGMNQNTKFKGSLFIFALQNEILLHLL